MVWEQPSLRTPGQLIYTVSQRTVNGRRIKEHQRVTEIAAWEDAFCQAQQWAWTDERQNA